MAVLTKEQIVGAEDIARELVPVPEWGGEVWVGQMSALERSHYQASMFRFGKDGEIQSVNAEGAEVRLAALTLENEDRTRMFGRKEVEALGKKSPIALDRVCEVARRLNGLDDAAEDREAGNSATSPTSISPTS